MAEMSTPMAPMVSFVVVEKLLENMFEYECSSLKQQDMISNFKLSSGDTALSAAAQKGEHFIYIQQTYYTQTKFLSSHKI